MYFYICRQREALEQVACLRKEIPISQVTFPQVKRAGEWKRYSGEYDTVSESKEEVEVHAKVTNRHSGDFQPTEVREETFEVREEDLSQHQLASSLPAFSPSHLYNPSLTPTLKSDSLQAQVELPMTEFLPPAMEESFDLGFCLTQDSDYSLYSIDHSPPSSLLLAGDPTMFQLSPGCHTLTDLTISADDSDFYSFY